MSSIRNSRARLLPAAAAVAFAAFSLTACGGGSADDDARSSGASSPSASSRAVSSSHHDAEQVASGSKAAAGDAATVAAGKRNARTSAGKAVTCQGSNTRTEAQLLNRPANHMLLTVTNTSSSTCYLYAYPAVRFGEAQSVPPAIEASKPQAVVTLAPGESGYASVNLSSADGSGGDGHVEKSLTVYFQGRTPDEDVPAGAHPSLPAEGVYIDDSLKVTYWQQSLEDAIKW
ncbi:DUF4232 domain-containing protein [Streptomyces albus]|uniref:DUF4232 domain-containing protein n=1 Tax=Streptomyces sp. NRRL F-5639 TaxID=1463867 RepID=UPI0004C636A5|nr:DUF4232 domain-containing protein [Streptomyces sp. NRRL F-5639]